MPAQDLPSPGRLSPGTLFVSATSPLANHTTIQSAIASLPHDATAHTILIAPGTYIEQLNVTRPGPLTLLGQTNAPFPNGSAPYADVHSDTDHANEVTVVWSRANADSTGKITDNAVTSVLTVAPTWEAALTGTGPTGYPVSPSTPPGSRDFRLYNVDLRNLASDRSVGPALALGWATRALVSTAAGTNTTFPNKYGAYISSSRVIAANSTIGAAIEGQCPLGRPWNALHRSVFMNSYLDASILPAGYIQWQDTDPRFDAATTLEAVYRNQGPGYDEAAMGGSNVTTVLNDTSVEPYASPRDVFMGWEGEPDDLSWIDNRVLRV
ncbi:hypothetical protein PG997_008123 [Apiospora hydei]|uniref:pectinesterase n=1 Tax=Apiospora hydei TaxID=1337664 RepID=A0ABR1W9X6_9PEZI